MTSASSASIRSSVGLLREAVDAAVAAGRVRDLPADTICQILWSCVHGVTALLVNYGPKFPHAPAVPDLVEQACDNALRGLLEPAPEEPR